MVPSDSFTTLATSRTDRLKLCNRADTSSAEEDSNGEGSEGDSVREIV